MFVWFSTNINAEETRSVETIHSTVERFAHNGYMKNREDLLFIKVAEYILS